MLVLLVCSPEDDAGLVVLKARAAALGFSLETSTDVAAAELILAGPDAPRVLVFGPSMSPERVFPVLDALQAAKHPALVACAFRGPLVREGLLALAARINHFFLDIDDPVVVDKKLSNLKSLLRLQEEKRAAAALEARFAAESEKLVEVNVNNVRLLAEVHQKNKQLSIAERNIKDLLENLGQGFLTVDRSGVVRDGYSSAATELFAVEPVGKTLQELLGLEAAAADSLSTWLELVFTERLPFADLLPLAECSLQRNGRYIEIDYRPLRAQEGTIERLIVIATDKTAERHYREKAAHEEQFAGMVLKAVRDRPGFADFLRESTRLLAALDAALAAGTVADYPAAFRHAHTLKGNAAAYGLVATAAAAHALETELAGLRHGTVGGDTLPPDLLAGKVAALQAAFEREVDELEKAVGSFSKQDGFRLGVDRDSLRRFESLLVAETAPGSVLRNGFREAFYHAAFWRSLVRFVPLVRETATRLGKRAEVRFVSDKVRAWMEPYRPLLQSLVHLLRNALDHGIETPEEREAVGKDPVGRILMRVKARPEGKGLCLSIEDDGRGIDESRVRERALAAGIVDAAELAGMDRAAVFSLLFRPGFSTREAADEWSGRGVGLDAVAGEVEKLGGTIRLRSVPGHGAAVMLFLPLLEKPEDG